MTDRLYLNADDVAARLKISTTTLYRWVKKKDFPPGTQVRREGKPGPRTTSLWDIREVDQWAIDNGITITTDPTLQDRDYLTYVKDPSWVKTSRTVAYLIGGAIITYLIAMYASILVL
jgi:predicted DNA-binding transcriptional regulator AlpA